MLRTRGQAVSGRTFGKKGARTCQPWTKSVGERLRFTSNVAVTVTTSTSTSTRGGRRNASSKKSTTGGTTKGEKRKEMGVRKERSRSRRQTVFPPSVRLF